MAVGPVWAASFPVLLVHSLLPRAGIALGHCGMATRYEYTEISMLTFLSIHACFNGTSAGFSPEGLPPMSQYWMALFARERLLLDQYCHHKDQERDRERDKSSDRDFS